MAMMKRVVSHRASMLLIAVVLVLVAGAAWRSGVDFSSGHRVEDRSQTTVAGAVVPTVSSPADMTSTTDSSKPRAMKTGNPLVNANGFYVPFSWNMTEDAKTLRAANREEDAKRLERVASMSTTSWLTGTKWDLPKLRNVLNGGNQDVGAARQQQLPIFAVYNLPHRDCGYYSAGGVDVPTYRAWIDSISKTIGAFRAVVVLEPDAIHVTDCLSAEQKSERWSLIRYAATKFKRDNAGVVSYIAAAAYTWNIDERVSYLKESGIELTRGIALNVSGFEWTKDCIEVGDVYRKKLGMDIHYIIDTSRNGNGPHRDANNKEAEWCNPPGRKFGASATTNTDNEHVDAFVWIKDGALDGDCWKSQHFENRYDYALQLARNTWG